MAIVPLSTFRDYWKNVSDWVKGIDTISKPKVEIASALPTGSNVIGSVQLTGSYVSNQGILVNTLQLPWREDFAGSSLDPNKWTIVQQGSGHTVSVAGSVLSIATGTTANTETVIRSNWTFTVPFRVWFIFYLSQRIANQEFYLEVVDSTGQHYAQWLFDGTTVTTGKYNVANANTAGSVSSVSILTTASYAVAEIELFPDEVYFVNRQVDSTNQKFYTYCRTRLIPDPLKEYYVQIRAKNLSTAPASSTTIYVDAVIVQDIAELTAEITGGRGAGGSSQSVPVWSMGGSVGVTSLPTWSPYNRDYLTFFTDSTTALAANATFTGTSRDTGATGSNSKVRARAYASHPGTLYIDQSWNGTTWRSTDSIAVGAEETKFLEAKIVARYVRVRYVNGATAQTAFELISALAGIGA